MPNITIPEYADRNAAHKAVRNLVLNASAIPELKEQAIAIAKHWGLELALPEAWRVVAAATKVNRTVPTPTEQQQDWSINLDLALNNFVTKDKEMLELKHTVRILAPLDDAVLIHGETGTGKEIIAQALHGARDPSKFVDINCAGMPEYLIESELFGHVRGAFTGAEINKQGLFREADGGTLFLDEIGDLPLQLQAKFLRALQTKRIRPVGSNVSIPVNCRIVAASHSHIGELVKAKRFREDLFARLNVFELLTKPIRDRQEDIPLIIKALDESGTFPLEQIDWKGKLFPHNYRDLQKLVRRWNVLKELPKQ